MSSSKDTPDFNKSIGNETLKHSLCIASPQMDSCSFDNKLSFKNSINHSLNPSHKASLQSLKKTSDSQDDQTYVDAGFNAPKFI